MKRIIISVFSILSTLPIFCQQRLVSGVLTENEVWADSIIIFDDLVVPQGVVLSVAPGTVVLGAKDKKLVVHGQLLSVGTPEHPIRYTSVDTTGVSDTTSSIGTWGGIYLLDHNQHMDSSILDFTIVEYGGAYGSSDTEKYGGGVYIDNSSSVRVSNSVIWYNYAQMGGAGIHVNRNSNPIIRNNVIRNNITQFEGGGIMSAEGSAPIIVENIIIENTSAKLSQVLPGLYHYEGRGGGICISTLTEERPTKIVNNIVCNNFSTSGGGIYESAMETQILSNIICNNRGTGVYTGISISRSHYANNTIFNNDGRGITTLSSNIRITNNIVHHNFSIVNFQLVDTLDVQFQNLEGFDPRFLHNNVGTAASTLSLMTTGDLLGVGLGNIRSSPQFLRPSAGFGTSFSGYDADWRLVEGDADIDAGTIEGIADLLPERDVYGSARIRGGTIDIGAAEYDDSVSVGQPESRESGVNIYPNPFSGQIWITLDDVRQPWNLVLWDTRGKAVRRVSPSQAVFQLQTDDLPPGIYFCEGRTKSGRRLFIRKIVKG